MGEIIYSIVVPTYRRPHVLEKTLACLERQVCNFPFEVIIVNDGPSEELPDLHLGSRMRKKWKLIQNGINLGRAATRNRGINSAVGVYLLMLDDDIWAVQELVQAHYEKQKEIGGGVVVGAVPPAKEINNTICNRYIAKRYEEIHNRLRTQDLDFGLFLTGNVSVPLDILKSHGGFNENFKAYSFEDSELGYRLFSKGIRFVHASAAIGYHFYNEDLNKICSKEYEAGRSLYLFVKIHPELFAKMQMHSISLLPWKKADIIKNILKLILFASFSRKLLKLLTNAMGKINNHIFVFMFLPWLELMFRAKGLKDSQEANK